jgi:hypothetical protein
LRKQAKEIDVLLKSVFEDLRKSICITSLENQGLLPTASWRFILNRGLHIDYALFDKLNRLFTKIESHNYEMKRVRRLLDTITTKNEARIDGRMELARAIRLEKEMNDRISETLRKWDIQTESVNCEAILENYDRARNRARQRKDKWGVTEEHIAESESLW